MELLLSTYDDDRLAVLDSLTLAKGNHSSPEAGMCAMEAVAWIAREPHTDHPACVSPVIGAFVRNWNDSLPQDDRDRLLKPLLPLLLGTAATAEVETARAWMATDWLVRVHTPAWLRLAGLVSQAETLESMPALDGTTTPGILPALKAVRSDAAAAGAAAGDAAWDAAGAAARDAAGAAAGDAAGAAAWAAAGDAAGAAAGAAAWDAAWDAAGAAAGAAAGDAAGAAAWDAAWAAAGAAAGAALRPTVATLQDSASDLVARMCAA